jgi:hypothetical protein
MTHRWILATALAAAALAGGLSVFARQTDKSAPKSPPPPFDAIADAQTPRAVPADRPELRKTEHDKSPMFDPKRPAPLSPAFKDQHFRLKAVLRTYITPGSPALAPPCRRRSARARRRSGGSDIDSPCGAQPCIRRGP